MVRVQRKKIQSWRKGDRGLKARMVGTAALAERGPNGPGRTLEMYCTSWRSTRKKIQDW